MSDPAPRRPRWWAIALLAAALTLPVAALLDGPIGRFAAVVLCPRDHAELVVRVSRDQTRDQRFAGSSGATSLCVDPATASACRWGRPSCRSVAVSTFATYATLLGIAFALALLPAAGFLVMRRRRPR